MDKFSVGAVPSVSAVRADKSGLQLQSGIQFVDGHEYTAEVVSFANGQIVMVRIQDTLLNMKLNNNLAPGQMITLKYVGGHAVPTFTLVHSDTPEALSGYVALSQAGTVIGQYLQEVDQIRQYDQAVSTKIPLLSAPWNAEQSAQELQQSIVQSGLFYESHQANFARGKNTIEHLLKEPQNQEDFNSSEMVAKQLEIIEKNTIKWSGSVWPGQLMRWTTHLSGEQPYTDDHAASSNMLNDVGTDITSQLELSLPKLKDIAANFTLSGDSLTLSLEVKDSHTLNLMQRELGMLINALTASGQKLAYCVVKPHEPHE